MACTIRMPKLAYILAQEWKTQADRKIHILYSEAYRVMNILQVSTQGHCERLRKDHVETIAVNSESLPASMLPAALKVGSKKSLLPR